MWAANAFTAHALPALLIMMFDFLLATLIATGGFLAVLALSLNIIALAGDAESAYLMSVEAANQRSSEALQLLQQQQQQQNQLHQEQSLMPIQASLRQPLKRRMTQGEVTQRQVTQRQAMQKQASPRQIRQRLVAQRQAIQRPAMQRPAMQREATQGPVLAAQRGDFTTPHHPSPYNSACVLDAKCDDLT